MEANSLLSSDDEISPKLKLVPRKYLMVKNKNEKYGNKNAHRVNITHEDIAEEKIEVTRTYCQLRLNRIYADGPFLAIFCNCLKSGQFERVDSKRCTAE